jgi:hypothetical protein
MVTTIETIYICACILMGDIEGKPFTATKLADYMDVPRATVRCRVAHLERWGLVYRVGYKYFASDRLLIL